MNKQEYIDSIIYQIKNKGERALVKKELSDHIEDRISFYADAGYDEETATQRAMERMGNPDEVAKSMSNLHNSANYKVLSLIFSGLYFLGIIIALALTLSFFGYIGGMYIGDDNNNAMGVCIGSVLVFLIASLSFYFAHKSQDESAILVNGITGIIGAFTAPLAFIPCGYSILSLFFEFPYYCVSPYE